MAEHKNAEQWRNVVYFDSESDLEETPEVIRHRPKLICATRIDRARGKREEADFEGNGFCPAFYSWLASGVYPHTTTYVIAHNIGYDLLATGGVPHLARLGFQVESLYEKGFTYILRLRGPERRGIVCLSSTQYWTSKLAKVAPLFGLTKLETSGEKAQEPDFERLRVYCRQDVLIVERAMEWLQEFIHDNDLGGMALTLPSLAMKAFRHRFMKYPPVIHNYEPVLLLERENYHGGRTEAWTLGKLEGKIFYVDFNSLYPSRMAARLHPVRLVKLYPQATLEQLHELSERYFVVADLDIRSNRRVLPVKRERLLFPTGAFRAVVCSPELELLRDDEVVGVRGVAVYEQAPIFQDFVEYFYGERLKAKTNNEEAKSELLKLIMNALYGKFGQQRQEWVKVGEAPPDVVKSEDFLLPTGKVLRMRTFGGATWVNDGAVMESFESFPAIASSVTSGGRALLWQAIECAGEENVHYMDTDSLFVNESGYTRLEAAGWISASELGKLKLEDVSEDVEIYGAKQYRFGTKAKHKGIPKDAKLIDGKAAVVTWPKIATFIRDGNLDGFENRIVLKSITTEYTKGTRTAGGRVEAPVLNEL